MTGKWLALLWCLPAVFIAACSATRQPAPNDMPVRASTIPEAERVMAALVPLLRELNYPFATSDRPMLADGCKVGLLVVPRPFINAGARPGKSSLCVHFTLFLTEGALAKLSVSQLRAIFAHELGHVRLGHFQSRRDRRKAGGLENWWLFGRAYDRDEEAAADDYAVQLLSTLEDRYPGACMSLALVFDALAEQGLQQRVEWLSTHQAPERRAQRVAAACDDPAKKGSSH